MDKKGLLIVISGFSGVGKGTVVRRLVQDYGYSLSISATTRAPREGEVDGQDYYFKTKADFMNLIDYNGFIEWAVYVENYYGTPRAFVEQELAQGHNVILEIEVQGAMNIKSQYPEAVLIFLTAPSAAELKKRLIGRGTEDSAVVDKRMKRAVEESGDMNQYEYIIVNDDLDQCVKDVNSVIVAKSCMIEKNIEFVNQMKAELQAL